MFKTLDKYIIKKFLGTFFFSVLLFSLISVVMSFSEKVNKFLDHNLSAEVVLKEYYIHFIPYINALLWPLFSLIAVVFFTSRLARNSEVISALNAGMSFTRFLRPYLIGAFFLATVHFVANHFIIPKGNKTMLTFENKYFYPNNDETKRHNIHMFLDAESKIYLKNFRKGDTIGRDFRLEKFQDNEIVYLLEASTIKWKGKPDKWEIRNYSIQEFDDEEESLILNEKTPLDTSFAFTPWDLERYSNQKEMMTTPELQAFIANEKRRGLGATRKMQVEMHRRTADPITIIILTIIGAAIAARKIRGGMGLHLAMGIAIGALFIVMSQFSLTFANNLNVSSSFAVWIPNILFGIASIILVIKAQK